MRGTGQEHRLLTDFSIEGIVPLGSGRGQRKPEELRQVLLQKALATLRN